MLGLMWSKKLSHNQDCALQLMAQSPIVTRRIFRQPSPQSGVALPSLGICGCHKVIIARDHSKLWTVRLVFINIGTLCRNSASQQLLCELIIWSWLNFSHQRKRKSYSIRRDAKVCWKVFLINPSWIVLKNWSFLILYKNYRMSSYTTCFMIKSDTPI